MAWTSVGDGRYQCGACGEGPFTAADPCSCDGTDEVLAEDETPESPAREAIAKHEAAIERICDALAAERERLPRVKKGLPMSKVRTFATICDTELKCRRYLVERKEKQLEIDADHHLAKQAERIDDRRGARH